MEKEQIKQLIALDDLEEAISILSKLYANSNSLKEKEIIAINGRANNLKSKSPYRFFLELNFENDFINNIVFRIYIETSEGRNYSKNIYLMLVPNRGNYNFEKI